MTLYCEVYIRIRVPHAASTTRPLLSCAEGTSVTSWRLEYSMSRAELLVRHREQIFRERPRILASEHRTRRERRLLQLLRELDVERAAGLEGVPAKPF